MCLSTEEILAEFKRLNDSDISDDVVVGSADVKTLYPNLDIPFAVDKACEIFYDSAVQIVGIDTEELGLYLALNRTKEQLEELGLLPYCPTRKTRRGRPPAQLTFVDIWPRFYFQTSMLSNNWHSVLILGFDRLDSRTAFISCIKVVM